MFFEDFAVRDLLVYADRLGGDDLINDGAESLKKLRDKIVEKSDEQAPSFLLVLTAVGGGIQARGRGVCGSD